MALPSDSAPLKGSTDSSSQRDEPHTPAPLAEAALKSADDIEASHAVKNYGGPSDRVNSHADPQTDSSRLEIQELIDQFAGHAVASDNEDIDRSSGGSLRADFPLGLPARKSSLQPFHATTAFAGPESIHSTDGKEEGKALSPSSPQSPVSSPSMQKALPPSDPEPDLPFDFHRFLEQLRHRTADPVAKFLRSFLTEFGKKQWMVHEQIKIVGDFLSFIAGKMAQCDVWRDASDAEFENAREGMEKLVMNRLYSQTFSPAIPPARTISSRPDKTKGKQPSAGRRGQHQEDVERDEVLAQKIRIYQWINVHHLDIPSVDEQGKRFLNLAQQELLKIRSYRAPRDKVICVLNCCKVLFGLLRKSKNSDTSADAFMPLLIFVVLQANPDHLVSNIQYILRFRSQDRLGGETGYYVSSLTGAIQFIENMDRTVLSISDDEFEREVEAAVSAMAERDPTDKVFGEQSATDAEIDFHPVGSGAWESLSRSPKAVSQPAGLAESADNPITGEGKSTKGILQSIQGPLSSIGTIFADGTGPSSSTSGAGVTGPHLDPTTSQPSVFARNSRQESGREGSQGGAYNERGSPGSPTVLPVVSHGPVEQSLSRPGGGMEHHNVVETLVNMFPDLERDVILDVVRVKNGSVSSAVDVLLALNA